MYQKILLVEDDARTRSTVSHHLRNEGYEVAEVCDGAEAARLIDVGRFDLVITDLVLPNVDGLKLVARVRTRLPQTPVILMTGFLTDDAAQRLLEGGAEVVRKPVKLENLATTVKSLLTH